MNDNMKPIAVGVSEARAMGRWGLTRFYQKVLPELDSFLDGKSRKITVESIERYINNLLAAGEAVRARTPPPFKKGALPPIPRRALPADAE
jgi:hypothetical protein